MQPAIYLCSILSHKTLIWHWKSILTNKIILICKVPKQMAFLSCLSSSEKCKVSHEYFTTLNRTIPYISQTCVVPLSRESAQNVTFYFSVVFKDTEKIGAQN